MVCRLEDAFRKYFNIKHAIAFNSATAALHAACAAFDVRSHNVSVTPFSFTSSVSCVRHAGGLPEFIDIDPKTYCVDSLKSKLPIIIPVHLFGGCADMDVIKARHNVVIEDAAQAMGSKYKGQYAGTIGDCGVFSFNQSKLISCGEGGMMITNNDDIAYKAKLVRNHGEVLDINTDIIGYNYRMTEIEAIIAYHHFQELDNIIDKRRNNVEYFRKQLLTIDGVTPMWINPDVEYSWYVYAFEVKNNKAVAKAMTDNGIPLRPGYITRPLNIAYGQSCPVCEEIWNDKLIVTDVIGKDKIAIDHFVKMLSGVMKGV
jgi:perosamine synthetase